MSNAQRVERGLLDRIGELETMLREIHEIAAREWAADETNYEWYGDIAGMVEGMFPDLLDTPTDPSSRNEAP